MDEPPVNSRMYTAALASLVILVAGTLLFPDTFANVRYHLGPIRISVLTVLFVLAAPSIFLYALANRDKVNIRALDFFLVAIMLYIIIRVALATHQADAGTLMTVAYAAYALVLYYGMAVVGQGKNGLRTMYVLIITLVIIIAGYALLEFFLDRNILFGDLVQDQVPDPERGYHRSGSTLGHPVVLGLFLVQAAPFLIYKYASVSIKRKRLLWGGIIVLIFLALEVTLTKGAWITGGILGAAMIAWLWRRQAARKPMIMLLVSISLVLVVFTFVFQDSIRAGVSSKARMSESFSPRLYMWEKVPAAFAANPVFGAGMWQGVDELYRVRPVDAWMKNPPKAIDNQFLTLLVEHGVVGSLLAGAAVVLIGLQAWKLLRAGGSFAMWAVPIVISLSAVLIDGVTFESMMIWPNMVIFWLLAGALRAMIELKEKGRESDMAPPVRA